jgi:hypothetical protein
VSLERGAGSGDDGSILRDFVGPIFMRPITLYVEINDCGHAISLYLF